jgi:hypothetical protein
MSAKARREMRTKRISIKKARREDTTPEGLGVDVRIILKCITRKLCLEV